MSAKFVASFLVISLHLSCPDEKNCVTCSESEGSRFCGVCTYSYMDFTTKLCTKKDMVEISKCLVYNKINDQIGCTGCELGFWLTPEKKCERCPVEGCALCDDGFTCFGCFNRRKLNPPLNACEKDEKCKVDNCDICGTSDGKDFCIRCSDGYAQYGYNVFECLKSPSHCVALDNKDPSKCHYCRPGYYITSNGECLPDQGGSSFIFHFIIIAIVVAACFFVYQHQKKANNGEVYAASLG